MQPSPTPMMLQIKFGCNRPAGLGDIHVWKCGRTHGRMPARVPSYKLTLWAFGSGELKTKRRKKEIVAFYNAKKKIQNILLQSHVNYFSDIFLCVCFLHTSSIIYKRAMTWQNQQNECAHSEDSDQPGHPPSLIRVFTVRMKTRWVLSYPLSAQPLISNQ